jgi:hypothetical protein
MLLNSCYSWGTGSMRHRTGNRERPPRSWLDPSKHRGTRPSPCTIGPPSVAISWCSHWALGVSHYHKVWRTTGPCTLPVLWFYKWNYWESPIQPYMRSDAHGPGPVHQAAKNPSLGTSQTLSGALPDRSGDTQKQPRLGSLDPNFFHLILPFLWASLRLRQT